MIKFRKAKCAQCGMELNLEEQYYLWGNKKFCCKECKRAYRLGRKKGGSSCH